MQPRQDGNGPAGAWPSPLSCLACALQVVQVAKWHGRMIVRLLQPDKHAAWVDLQELAANAACITIVQVSHFFCKACLEIFMCRQARLHEHLQHVHAAAQHAFMLARWPRLHQRPIPCQPACAAAHRCLHTLSSCLT